MQLKPPATGKEVFLLEDPWILAVVLLAALGVLVWSLKPKLELLRRAGCENLFDRPADRFWNVLHIALGQSKMFKDPGPGWMHALIFWGFLVLLIRAAEFFLMGFFSGSVQIGHWLPVLGHPYYLVKDGFVLLVTLACCYALHRRLVVKPERLTLSLEGIAILGLILLIMLSDVAFEGANGALIPEGPTAWSPLGYGVTSLVSGLESDSLQCIRSGAWWTHILTILVFTNLLPRSKHFHVMTSIPNVYFSRAGQKGNGLRRLDFEDEQQESFGVTRIEEFSWKSLFDLHTCTECGRCDVFCPALNSQKPLSPKRFTVALRDHLNQVEPFLLAAPPDRMMEVERPDLMGQTVQDETVWSCTTCGACEEECPVMIEYVGKMIDLRRGLVLTEDRYPNELGQAFRALETHSNPWGFPADTRADWAKELDIPLWDKQHPTEYLYFVGCNGSFDKRGRSISRAVAEALLQAGVSFSILGNRESCTGDPARRLGNEYLFDMLAQQNAETLKDEKVLKVITHCPHCFNSLKHEYPEFGAHLEVLHHSEVLARLMKEGRLQSKDGHQDEKVVIHDSCYMGRHNNEYEAPRDMLSEGGIEVREVETSRERGTCCGAGGGRFLLEENTGTRMSHNRVDELLESGADTIAVSCPYCVLMLEDAVKGKGLSDQVKVRDVSEMLGI